MRLRVGKIHNQCRHLRTHRASLDEIHILFCKSISARVGSLTILTDVTSGLASFPVQCFNRLTLVQARDLTDSGLVWQVDFNQTWASYKQGFGDPMGGYWIGLEKLEYLTTRRHYRLMVSLHFASGSSSVVAYSKISLDNETLGYRLKLGSPLVVSSYMGDALHGVGVAPQLKPEGMAFSTYDRDNDLDAQRNCAGVYGGGWWYNACTYANLNGQPPGGSACNGSLCLSWGTAYPTGADANVITSNLYLMP